MTYGKVMFCSLIYIFLILNNTPATYSLKNKIKPCGKIHSCTCIFPTGSGVNLALINQTLSVQVSANVSISVHLCSDVSFEEPSTNLTLNQCQNVSVCYKDHLKNEYLSLGKADNLTFLSESQYKPMSLHFNNTANTTNIALTCDATAELPKVTLISHQGSVFNLELVSKHVCVRLLTPEEGPGGGLSTGSVLIILLLVLTLAYFGGGMLTLRLLRGAEGKEMIPNIDFWTDLPYLVRDGILFTINGFQSSASYDRI